MKSHRSNRRRWMFTAIILILVAALPAAFAWADVVTFKQGAPAPITGGPYAGADDTMLVINGAGNTDQNFGARTNFEVGEDPGGSNALRHTLMRFDVTALAGQYASIDAVTLRLFPIAVNTVGADSMQAFRVAPANAAWVEGTGVGVLGGDPPDVGESTWAQRVQGSQNWAGSQGASTPGADYTTMLGSTAFSGATGTGAANPFDITFDTSQLAALFNDWTSGNNSGLLLRVVTESDRAMTFNSAEATDPALRPELIVSYTAIPEASSMAFLALAAGLALLRARAAAPVMMESL